MRKIGNHPNLVNMVACIIHTRPQALILELCEDGDLLTYVRERRNKMLEVCFRLYYSLLVANILPLSSALLFSPIAKYDFLFSGSVLHTGRP